MQYTRVHLEAFGYELAPVVVSSTELESRLEPLYEKLRIAPGQLEALTGITERRWWEPGDRLSRGASIAASRALEGSGVSPSEVETVIYAGVCREDSEPATACHVAAHLRVSDTAAIYDISNACLGVLNGIIEVANRIELGQIRAGLVVSAETAREINDITIERMLAAGDMETFTHCLATLTGGSGAVAVLLTDGSFSSDARRRLLGGVTTNAPEHHDLCRWGTYPTDDPFRYEQIMNTDSVSVLKYGVELGIRTWSRLTAQLDWTSDRVDRVICHQVGSAHQATILESIGVSPERDFITYPFLGNIGTVSLPLTAALAEEREFLMPGHRVAFLGIGSGLNCMMLGWEW